MLIYKWFFWPWFFTVATIYHAEHKGPNLMSTIYKEKLIHSNFFVIPIRYSTYVLITPPIFRVWFWLKVPAKYFKICHDTKKKLHPKVRQILKCFTGIFHWAQTLKLGGVICKTPFLRFTWLNLKSSALKQHLFKFSLDAI